MNIMTLILLLLYGCVACNNTSNEDNQKAMYFKSDNKKMVYKELIDTIEAKVIDLTSISDLFSVEEFMSIYEQPSQYKEDALSYISDTLNSRQKRMIAVYSIQNLPDSHYINFCKSAFELYTNKIIPKEILEQTLFDSINDKYQIIRNYKNSDVIALLEMVQARISDDALKDRINNVISGKTWNDIEIFLRGNK